MPAPALNRSMTRPTTGTSIERTIKCTVSLPAVLRRSDEMVLNARRSKHRTVMLPDKCCSNSLMTANCTPVDAGIWAPVCYNSCT